MSVRFLPFVWGSLFICAPAAWATPIDLLVDPSYGSTGDTGATGLVSLSFSQRGSDSFMTVRIQNTTPPQIGSRLTAVGLEIPDSLSSSIDFARGGKSRYFDTLTLNRSIWPRRLNAPGGYDLMLTSDGNFQGGCIWGAPVAGSEQTVVLSLGNTMLRAGQLRSLFADYYAELDDNYVIARFQAVGPCGHRSDKVMGAVPEPSSLGLLVVAALLQRRRGRAGF
jgi:hypothetical protein